MVSWNPAYFSQAWAEFGAQHFDVCVIGGGSVGRVRRWMPRVGG